jgi:hypothetical protein
VYTPGGYAPNNSSDLFTFNPPPPAITSISPSSGLSTGGTTVTITGSNFTGATKVTFGPVAATSFTVVSSTEITAVSPAEAPGSHYIVVYTPGGYAPNNSSDLFTFNPPPPAITSISPSSGPAAGGTTVTITGTNLGGATKVTFGPVAATSFTVVSSTEITAVSPAEAAGSHYIVVDTPGGVAPNNSGDLFTFQ